MSDVLASLYGETEGRLQRIHTPGPVLQAIARLWPEGIALDPSGSPDGLVVAERIVIPPEDGLIIDWPERTYCNPPYDSLETWLSRYTRSWEAIMLVPVRTHRRWFRAAMRASSQVVWLDPLRFVGFEAAFPTGLCFLYRGSRDLQREAERAGLVKDTDESAQTDLWDALAREP